MEREARTQVLVTGMWQAKQNSTRVTYPAASLVYALGALLIGGLLCLIDINIAHGTMMIDVVPDVIGYALIVGALAVLARVRLGATYSAPLAFAQMIACLSLVHGVAAIWVVTPSSFWYVVTGGLGVAREFAGVAFCGAMMVLARSAGATRSYTLFRSARTLIGLFIAGPLLVIFLWALVTGNYRSHYQLHSSVGWFVVLVIAVGLLTILQLFVAVRRLQHELATIARPIG